MIARVVLVVGIVLSGMGSGAPTPDQMATTQFAWEWGILGGHADPEVKARFPIAGITTLATGAYHSLALQTDGTLWGWGDNTYGQLGVARVPERDHYSTPIPIATPKKVAALAAGRMHGLAVQDDGTVLAWGLNDAGQARPGPPLCPDGPCSASPTLVPGLSGVMAAAGGGFHSLALRADGTVWGWGDNTWGQLGGAAVGESRVMPQPIDGLADVAQIAAGYLTSLAVKRDGTVWTWGLGILGDGQAQRSSATPVQVRGLRDVVSATPADSHIIALKRDGTAWGWGYNALAQLGRSCPIVAAAQECGRVPVQIAGLSDVRAISANGWHNLALRADGTVWSWGGGYVTLGCPVLGICRDGDYGGPCSQAPAPVENLRGAVLISAGVGHNVVLSPTDVPSPTGLCFPEAGIGPCIRGIFMDRWLNSGGLAINGYPLSDEMSERLEDGLTHVVQYFERARFEDHPSNPPNHRVLLGQFGRRVLGENYHRDRPQYPAAVAAAAPLPDRRYFDATGHNLGGRFLAYWEANGGLAQFGFPLTEEFAETLEDGNVYTVQYFERARFEWHPENPEPYRVLLGQFGRRILADNALLATGPFAPSFATSAAAQVQLGRPVGAAITVAGAVQSFERGQLLALADTPPGRITGGLLPARGATLGLAPPGAPAEPMIIALCGGELGQVITDADRGRYVFADTWAPGQPAGGGPGPQPGLYEPGRGFGKVWREQPAVRDCLGYATTAEATAATITAQYFQGGALLLVAAPGERSRGLLTLGSYCVGCPPDGTYERQPTPPQSCE